MHPRRGHPQQAAPDHPISRDNAHIGTMCAGSALRGAVDHGRAPRVDRAVAAFLWIATDGGTLRSPRLAGMERAEVVGRRLVHRYVDRVVLDGFDAAQSFEDLVTRLEPESDTAVIGALREALEIALMVLAGSVSGSRESMAGWWANWAETYSPTGLSPSEKLRGLVARRRWMLGYLNDVQARIEQRVEENHTHDRLALSLGAAHRVLQELRELDRRIQIAATFGIKSTAEIEGAAVVHRFVETVIASTTEADVLFDAHVVLAVEQSADVALGALREALDWVEFQLRQMYHRPVGGMQDSWSWWKTRFDQP